MITSGASLTFSHFCLIFGFGLLMVATALLLRRGRSRSCYEFLLAGQSTSWLVVAMSVAASWVWAPALFVAAQKAFEQGIPGIFWFTFPNVLSLLLFAPLALRVRRTFPDGFTLPQYMYMRHGSGVHILYLLQFVVLQICCFAVQIVAGASLISSITQISYPLVALSIAGFAVIYSLIGGIRASLASGVFKLAFIYAISALIVPLAVTKSGGVSALLAGLGGKDGTFTNLFDPWVAYSFGLPATIALLSGPIGDQQHWQRAFSLRSSKDVLRAFVLASVFFLLVPLSLSLLGFAAAGSGTFDRTLVTNSQLVGPVLVGQVLPQAFSVLFCFMLLASLMSTIDSALCAVAGLFAMDLYKGNDKSSDGEAAESNQRLRWGKIGLVITACFGLAISLIPGISILHLWLIYATWRASTLIPSIVTILSEKVNSGSVFYAILLSMIFGAPVYATGTFIKNPHVSVIGAVSVVAIGAVVCGMGVWRYPTMSKEGKKQ